MKKLVIRFTQESYLIARKLERDVLKNGLNIYKTDLFNISKLPLVEKGLVRTLVIAVAYTLEVNNLKKF